MRRDLNETCSLRQIDRRVADLEEFSLRSWAVQGSAYLGQKDCIHVGIMLESRENSHSLNLGCSAVDSCLSELFRIFLQTQRISRRLCPQIRDGAYHERIHIVGKHDNLVTSPFVVINQELASLELVRIHDVQQDALATGFTEVFPVKFGSHGTPNLGTLDGSISPVHV